MMIENKKSRLLTIAESCLAAAFAVALVAVRPAYAGSDRAPGARSAAMSSDLVQPKSETINLNAGQSFTIEHLKPASPPAIQVLENSHAMVVHGENPGHLVLLGAERGRWKITVEREDGAIVAYQVNVAASADSSNPLQLGLAPAVSSDENASGRDSMISDSDEESPAPIHPSPDADENPAPVSSNDASMRIANQQASAGAATMVPREFHSDPQVSLDAGQYTTTSVDTGPNYLPTEGLSLMSGTSEIVDFPRRLKRISIADSTIADIQVTTPFQLNLIGHKPGFTTLAVWDDRGSYQERQVRVETGGKQQVLLNVTVAELDRTRLERQGIDFSAALANSGLSLVSLPGSVATPYSASSALASGAGAATGIAPGGGSLIPLLLSGSMTYGLSTLSSAIATQTFFQFLESHNLARILAQPHLLASSGQPASFISGGEIPIVLAQALNTSIVFKQFGTQINFLPTVVGLQDIELLVKTEVSEPDYAHGVQLFGFQVPAFVTRRADTFVRLRDNQTLIIAGLLLHNRQSVVQKVPYLGDLPFAGAIFRNTYWQDSETDLVMAVVPQIVRPLPPQGQVFLPSTGGPLNAETIRTHRLTTPDASRPRF